MTAVVIGIVDDGIAFAHERFRKIVNAIPVSRVEYWWLQDGTLHGNVPFGCELLKAEIDQLLTTCTHAGAVDEDELYQRAGLNDFQLEGHKSAAWRAAHGTHVMDLAGGFDPDPPFDDRPIVCVQLPIRVTADTSGGSLFPYVALAMTYIVNCALQIGVSRVVINLSYGRIAGPHDGTSPLEDAIETLVAQAAALGVSLRVTLPAGNSYLSRCHALASFRRRNQVVPLQWRVLPDDQTPSYLEIWLPFRGGAAGPSRLELTITSPTGQSRTIQEGGAAQSWASGPGVYGEARYAYMPFPTDRGRFLVTLMATADLNPANAIAPAGPWTVKLRNQNLARRDVIHAWVQRDDSLYGFPIRGRQAYFDNDCYKRFDNAGREIETDDPSCVLKRYGTINPIATGRQPIVMGGFLREEVVPAKYSAAGPITPQRGLPSYRDGPDAMTVSEDSRAHRGVLAAGSRSGSVVAMGGTSVAAPEIARWIADELDAGNPGDRAAVQARATADELGYPAGTPPRPPVERGGAGRINLPALIPLQRYWDK
jgi:hypothetical protein